MELSKMGLEDMIASGREDFSISSSNFILSTE